MCWSDWFILEMDDSSGGFIDGEGGGEAEVCTPVGFGQQGCGGGGAKH
jgi:hypothetical protein